MTDTGFIAYQMHMAMNLHFKHDQDYDFFTYNGKTGVKVETFRKSRFRWQFASLEKKVDNLLAFMYDAFKSNDFQYLDQRRLFKHAANKDLQTFGRRYCDTLNKSVEHDLQCLWTRVQYADDPQTLFCVDGRNLYPNIHVEYKEGKIGIETCLCFHSFLRDVYKEEYSNDVVAWPRVCSHMRAVAPFVIQLVGKETFEASLRSSLTSENDNSA